MVRSFLLRMVPILTASTVLLAQPDPEVTEVLYDPVGNNSGQQRLELVNGYLPVDLTGWTLATSGGAVALPAVTLSPYGVTLLHLGVAGTSTPTDLYLPTAPALGAIDSVALFRTSSTSNHQDLADFVSWNGGTAYIGLAVQARQWPSAQDTVSLPLQAGCTLAHFDQMAYGNRSRPESWFADCTPTLGTKNDGGGLFVYGYGCPQLTYQPTIGSGAEDNRPWIGQPWELDVYALPPVPTTIFVALGFSGLGTLPLDPFGMPGCSFEVDPLVIFARAMPAHIGDIYLSLPNDPGYVGLEIRVQGMVPFPGANAANMLPTREIRGTVGSR
ncbi:MAG: lamin tail domain-containing protein [bacterium]|nr:lamin tail domain-containing protein [bacterium]